MARANEPPSSYVLEMLPYPSGEPHIGHLKCYSVGDAIAHFHRRLGQRVLHPMGYDAFGLPAENHAIRTGRAPARLDRRIDRLVPAPVPRMGDLDRLVARARDLTNRPTTAGRSGSSSSCSSAGLAYRARGGRQVVPQRPDGARQRAGRRRGALRALRLRSSKCASSNSGSCASPTTPSGCSTDLDTIDWPEHVKTMQRNWIGRSEGAEVTFRCEELGIDYPVFTTRPDTLFGATFFVMAPEHPDVLRLAAGTEHEQAAHDYVNQALNETNEERGNADKPEDGRAARADCDQPGQRRADPDVRRRLRADGVRHRRDHGRARRTTSATTPSRATFELPIRRVIDAAGRRGRPSCRTRATGCSSTRTRTSTAWTTARRWRRSSRGSTARARATRRSTTGCATGWSRASATGAARSRSSTASAAASCRCPAEQLPVELPGHRGLRAEGPLAAGGAPRTG